MNISLPDVLRAYVDERVESGAYGSSSEYVRELIRRDHDRRTLRALLIDGATTPLAAEANGDYFARLRARIDAQSQE